MSTAIWTVILKKGSRFNSSYELANRNAEQAREEICQRHPGSTVIALVLGRHTSVYTFSTSNKENYELYDHSGNQPTGGSD